SDRGLLDARGGGRHGSDSALSEVAERTPGIAAGAARAATPSTLRGVAHLRLHETDPMDAVTKVINGLGGEGREAAEGLRIGGRGL
ncbi:3-phosphoshikimate 1-carboxyvinyltransferase, partial [Streptomyces sp. DT17]